MKPGIQFGLLAGLGLCGWVLGEFALGFHTDKLEIGRRSGYFSAIIPATCIWLALRGRRMRQGGVITFGEAFQTGMILSVVAAVITRGFMVVYNNFINPGWMAKAWEWERAQLVGQGATEQQIAKTESIMRATGSDLYQLTFGLIGSVIMGMIITAAVSLLMRRRPPEEASAWPPR